MLFKINRELMLKALTLTSGFLEKSYAAPILANVYIKKSGNTLTLISNDMEIQTSIEIEDKENQDDFVTTLPAKKLLDILKLLNDNSQVKFIQEESKVFINAGSAKFILQSLPAGHYPLINVNTNIICKIILKQAVLKKLLIQVQNSMAEKDSRACLNGLFVEIRGEELNLVATNGHRLSLASCKLETPIEEHSVIIPRKTILEVIKLLDSTTDDIVISFAENQVIFDAKNKQLISKIIDAKYPDYRKVLMLSNDKLFLISRSKLITSLERVSTIGVEKSKIVTFEFIDDTLKLSATNDNQEEAFDEINIVNNDKHVMTIPFNFVFIKELLMNLDFDQMKWAILDSKKSILVTDPSNPNFKVVMIPLKP